MLCCRTTNCDMHRILGYRRHLSSRHSRFSLCASYPNNLIVSRIQSRVAALPRSSAFVHTFLMARWRQKSQGKSGVMTQWRWPWNEVKMSSAVSASGSITYAHLTHSTHFPFYPAIQYASGEMCDIEATSRSTSHRRTGTLMR